MIKKLNFKKHSEWVLITGIAGYENVYIQADEKTAKRIVKDKFDIDSDDVVITPLRNLDDINTNNRPLDVYMHHSTLSLFIISNRKK